MRYGTAFMLAVVLAAGCAPPRKLVVVSYRDRQEERLKEAVQLLERGDRTRATRMLAAICAQPGIAGVTDEALFRLTLLRLGSETQEEGPGSARETIERLQREYPASPWSRQAMPLLGLLVSRSELLRANEDLRSRNLSLSRDVEKLTREARELRERLEKLKRLDLELEDQSR